MYRRNICFVLLLLGLLLLPASPRVLAQGCSPMNAVLSGSTYYFEFDTVYPNPPNTFGPWWRAGDYLGYEVVIATATTAPDLHWFNTSNVYVGVLHTFSFAYTPYTIGVNTGAISVISTAPFSGYVCANYIGTATPVPPTLTPTNTPVPPTLTPTGVPPTVTPFSSPTFTPETIVTATPVPSPTVNPTDILVERADQSFQLQLFGITIVIGLLTLVYVVKR